MKLFVAIFSLPLFLALVRESRPGTERVLFFREADGKQLWGRRHKCDYTTVATYAIGPRCTPTVDGGKVWSHPAFANKSVYVRNDKELKCYSLAKASQEQTN